MSGSVGFDESRAQIVGIFLTNFAARRLDNWHPLLATTVYCCSSIPGDRFMSSSILVYWSAANAVFLVSKFSFVLLPQADIGSALMLVCAVCSACAWQEK